MKVIASKNDINEEVEEQLRFMDLAVTELKEQGLYTQINNTEVTKLLKSQMQKKKIAKRIKKRKKFY